MDELAFVSPRFPPFVGGIETHVSELAERAATRFHGVSVITTDPSWRLPARQSLGTGLIVYRIRAFAPSGNYHFPASPVFFKRLVESSPRILHLHSIHDVPCLIGALFDTNRPIVFTPHFHGEASSTMGRMLFGAYRGVVRRLVGRANCIICVSSVEAGLLQTIFPSAIDKIKVIPNGVDLKTASNYPWREPERSSILYVGRLEGYKNVDKLLRAFALLRKNKIDLRLTIVGTGSKRRALHSLAEALGIDDGVEWLEGIERSELYRLYSNATAVVLPSDVEAYGIVAAEAIAIGTPTVLANTSGLSEFVSAGLAQPVEPPITSESLADQILQVLEDPKAFSFREKTSRLIPSWDEVASRTFSVYESLEGGLGT